MKQFWLFILWLVFSPAYFFISKKYGVSDIKRFWLTIFSPFTIIMVLWLLLKLLLWVLFGDIATNRSIDYPSNNAPTEITGVEFPELCPIDSSTFAFPAFVGVTKTYLPVEKPSKKFYKTLENKCKTDSFWTKEKDAYIYDNNFINQTITVQLPHLGDTIKVKVILDSSSF
jgi:hypothetical protein